MLLLRVCCPLNVYDLARGCAEEADSCGGWEEGGGEEEEEEEEEKRLIIHQGAKGS